MTDQQIDASLELLFSEQALRKMLRTELQPLLDQHNLCIDKLTANFVSLYHADGTFCCAVEFNCEFDSWTIGLNAEAQVFAESAFKGMLEAVTWAVESEFAAPVLVLYRGKMHGLVQAMHDRGNKVKRVG